jgi:hypothetical protein
MTAENQGGEMDLPAFLAMHGLDEMPERYRFDAKLWPPYVAAEARHAAELAKGLRVPTGDSLSEVRVRVVDGQLDLRIFRRSVDDFSPDGMCPTVAGLTVPLAYAEVLLEAIAKAAA